MDIKEAIEILDSYNEWRRGANTKMETPIRIGIAIDITINELKRIHNLTSFCVCIDGPVGRTVTEDFEYQICDSCGKYVKKNMRDS